MDISNLITQGNQHRAEHRPDLALACYAQAFVACPDYAPAWNNYGNVLRECGQPARSVPFLQHARVLDPKNITASFNLAVAWLAQGNYQQGWPQYESRWDYEHLAGTMPKYTQPRWTGQSIEGKTILVVGEQGHGDNIQFVRFLFNLHKMGARIKFMVTDALIPLLKGSDIFESVCNYTDDPGSFDYWISLMSIPAVFGVTLENLGRPVHYLTVSKDLEQQWLQTLGAKTRMRVGFCWSGRRDNWLNEHKGMPFEEIAKLIAANPLYDWINLQADATPEEEAELEKLGVKRFPGSIQNFSDTAGLIMTMDVVISVDTAVAHLAGALGRPVWVMLNWFAADWRWLVNRDDSPWYSTARLFRQPQQDDWASVTKKINQYLSWFKI